MVGEKKEQDSLRGTQVRDGEPTTTTKHHDPPQSGRARTREEKRRRTARACMRVRESLRVNTDSNNNNHSKKKQNFPVPLFLFASLVFPCFDNPSRLWNPGTLPSLCFFFPPTRVKEPPTAGAGDNADECSWKLGSGCGGAEERVRGAK
jgi:hypothetical protein